MLPKINSVNGIRNFLGESPFYDKNNSRIYWVDILKGTLSYWEIDSGQIGRWDLKQTIGCAVPIKNNSNLVLIAAVKGLGIFDLFCGAWIHSYENPEKHLLNNRWNDGKCSPEGRFWVGSMNNVTTAHSLSNGIKDGALYCINARSEKPVLRRRIDYIGISNGLAWSKSGEIMYHVDSHSGRVSEYFYYTKSGEIKLKKPDLIVIDPTRGAPDGCAIDADDNLWIALWGGSAVEHYSTKTGQLLLSVPIPDKYVTSVAWFGDQYEKLFVTTALSDSLTDILENYYDKSVCHGKSYVLDFTETSIRGTSVPSFDIGEFKG